MSIPYEPLNCSIGCTEMLNCMKDTDKIVCEIRCDRCGMANRFRIENYFISMLKQYGEATCQMGRKVYRTKDETCDVCKAGGELVAKVEQVTQTIVPGIESTSMGCQISPERMDSLGKPKD